MRECQACGLVLIQELLEDEETGDVYCLECFEDMELFPRYGTSG